MLDRKLEPEVMETPEEAREYDEMDHGEVNRLFVDDLLSIGPVTGDFLDLGTGTALIPIELCERVERCRVMAVDLSIEMLELARFRLEIAGLTHRIQLDQVDSKAMPYDDGMFDLVMSNSIIHHIPDPRIVIAEAIRVTKPGGQLFFRDLLRPQSEEELLRLVELHAGDENESQKRLFAESLHAALTVEEFQELLDELGQSPAEVTASSDRHWTWATKMAGTLPENDNASEDDPTIY